MNEEKKPTKRNLDLTFALSPKGMRNATNVSDKLRKDTKKLLLKMRMDAMGGK